MPITTCSLPSLEEVIKETEIEDDYGRKARVAGVKACYRYIKNYLKKNKEESCTIQ